MQSLNPAPVAFEIRPPWKDELLRVREFIPHVFHRAAPLSLLIAVQGPLERIIAAAAIIPPTVVAAPATLRWRLAGDRYRQKEILAGLFAQAAKLHTEKQLGARLRLGSMVDDAGLEATVLRELGFQTEAVHEVYDVSARSVWERLDPLYRRLTARGVIPTSSTLTHLTPERMTEAATFLARYLPDGEGAFFEENEGFKMEHSYVLLVDGVVKGLLLCRQSGEMSHVGVVLVARELRGGYAWANIALYYESLREAIEYGVERLRFTADPLLHPNTLGFALSWKAKQIGKKVRFFFDCLPQRNRPKS